MKVMKKNKTKSIPPVSAPAKKAEKEGGLADVVACNSAICFIDGEGG